MPALITRDEALHRIRTEVGDGRCLMCAVRDDRAGDRWVVDEDAELLLLLPRYVRRWGQLLVVLKPHVTRYHEVDPELWTRASAWALRAACVVEQHMQPVRCYITSTGSAAGELAQSSAHVHIHVIPVYDPDDRPRDIFSWQDGVYVAEPGEWRSLRAAYRERWLALAERR
ncbi:MAG TPA: HIT domain-containing protein [Nannocystaceae bacterium]|nr:HIT domain-containing protein [Nannocystaceae bacterium]